MRGRRDMAASCGRTQSAFSVRARGEGACFGHARGQRQPYQRQGCAPRPAGPLPPIPPRPSSDFITLRPPLSTRDAYATPFPCRHTLPVPSHEPRLARAVTLCQCRFGTPWQKPTRFRCFNARPVEIEKYCTLKNGFFTCGRAQADGRTVLEFTDHSAKTQAKTVAAKPKSPVAQKQ